MVDRARQGREVGVVVALVLPAAGSAGRRGTCSRRRASAPSRSRCCAASAASRTSTAITIAAAATAPTADEPDPARNVRPRVGTDFFGVAALGRLHVPRRHRRPRLLVRHEKQHTDRAWTCRSGDQARLPARRGTSVARAARTAPVPPRSPPRSALVSACAAATVGRPCWPRPARATIILIRGSPSFGFPGRSASLAADDADRDDRRAGREREPRRAAEPGPVAKRKAGALREHAEHLARREQLRGAADRDAVAGPALDRERAEPVEDRAEKARAPELGLGHDSGSAAAS